MTIRIFRWYWPSVSWSWVEVLNEVPPSLRMHDARKEKTNDLVHWSLNESWVEVHLVQMLFSILSFQLQFLAVLLIALLIITCRFGADLLCFCFFHLIPIYSLQSCLSYVQFQGSTGLQVPKRLTSLNWNCCPPPLAISIQSTFNEYDPPSTKTCEKSDSKTLGRRCWTWIPV